MAGKAKRMSQVKQLLRLYKQGKGNKTIARAIGISRNTVKSYLDKHKSLNLNTDALLSMEDPVLESIFHSGNPAYKDTRFEDMKSNLDYYEKELKRTGVTRKLLWEEYHQINPEGYSLSQFCYHLQQHLLTKHPSMVHSHNPGEKLYIDFAGKKLSYTDPSTGEIIECQVFVACLPYSDYGFCMAVRSQKIADFLHSLSCCLKFLGGVPKVLVTDNLKSAVIKADRYEPSINIALEDFANHYNTVVVPARSGKPKDKSLVENQVKLIYNRVYAKLRNRQFFSLTELNEAMKEKTKDHNQTRMQQKPWCREEMFLSEEKPLLHALPEEEFELKCYKEYKVAKNNHIYLSEDKHYYSVPYIHIGKQVKVIYTASIVRIYCKGQQIAVHKRDYKPGKYSTEKDHLCSTHKHYSDTNPDYYRNKAKQIDEQFYKLIDNIFKQNRYPEQLYRTCNGIFNLQRKTDMEVFTKACSIAIEHEVYTYHFLRNLILNNMTHQFETEIQDYKSLPKHDNIRGKAYYEQQQLNFKQI